MARVARLSLEGYPHHVTHRGNRRANVFFEDADRRDYLGLLIAHAARYQLGIWAYCLMSNHVHLIVVGERPDSMARCIGGTHQRYAQRVNRRRAWTGHLWANRFYSTPLDDHHLWAAVRYVELNPVRAALVRRPADFAWSSAKAHALDASDDVLAPDRPFPGHVGDWSEWLLEGLGDPAFDEIRSKTSTGRPCGSDGFIKRLEAESRRRLHPGRRGPRPHDPSDDTGQPRLLDP